MGGRQPARKRTLFIKKYGPVLLLAVTPERVPHFWGRAAPPAPAPHPSGGAGEVWGGGMQPPLGASGGAPAAEKTPRRVLLGFTHWRVLAPIPGDAAAPLPEFVFIPLFVCLA